MSAALHHADPDPTIAELVAARPHLSMHAMDGLVLDDVPLRSIAEATGTPCWVMSANAIRSRLSLLRTAFDLARLPVAIHYAVKANDHLAVLRLMATGGAGADVVSGGELHRAIQAGISPRHIVFSGVGKTDDELRLALDHGIHQINVESAEELARLSGLAAGRTASVALRINPDVDAGTHAKITTGRAGNKFGIAYDEAGALYAHAAALPGIVPAGIALHIGSQILSMAPYRAAYAKTAALVRDIRAAGHVVRTVDCGGGLGVNYRHEPVATPDALAGAIASTLGGLDLELAIEPGRWLVAQSCVLLAAVVVEKHTGGRRFVVLDAAMNDLLRPALYDSWHGLVPLSPMNALAPVSPADIVGPVCETGDTFARGRDVPSLAPGALIALLDTGAYGAVMSTTYNARPLAPIAMIDGPRWQLIRRRQAVEALWQGEEVPAWV